MQRTRIIPFFAKNLRSLAFVASCGLTLSSTASASIDDLFHDCTQKCDGGLEDARKLAESFAAGTGEDLGYHSNSGTELRDFSGPYTPPELPEGQQGSYLYGLAVFSDDGCDITIDGETVHSRYKIGQALPRLEQSFHPLPVLLQPGKEVQIEVKYSNTRFLVNDVKPDIDGCTLFLYKVRAGIIPDFNRDGKINDADRSKITKENPWHWWVNDDDDRPKDERGKNMDDVPNQKAWRHDHKNDSVDGIRDHIDFFPLHLDLANVLRTYPSDEYDYSLSHIDEALNFYEFANCQPNAGNPQNSPGGHVRSVSKAKSLATHDVEKMLKGGAEISEDYLKQCEQGRGVIMAEGRKPTNNPIVLKVFKKNGNAKVAEIEFPIRIGSVEEMFRQVNLRGVFNGAGGRETSKGEPSGYPDKLTNGKYVAYIHGYNVSGQSCRGSQSNLFKRFHQLGSRARFIGVSWNGNPPNPGLNLVMPPDYHLAVANGLLTGAMLKKELGFTQGSDLTVLAHSLGNSVASSAIANHGLKVKAYCMINGAIAIEAYDAGQTANSTNDPDMARFMTEDSWKPYYDYDDGKQRRLHSANWYQLFKDTPSDHRNKLTWRNLFAKEALFKVAYNFYSPSDEVVENPNADEEFGDWANLWDAATGGRHAWVQQEIAKGGQNKTASTAFGNLNGGWQFNRAHKKLKLKRLKPEDAAKIPDKVLITKPFHRKFLYDDLHHPTKGSAIAKDLTKRYTLLGTGLPATSYAIAANKIEKLGARNINMPAKMKNSKEAGSWPAHKNSNNPNDWMHSDFKDVSLQFVNPMYKKIIDLGSLD